MPTAQDRLNERMLAEVRRFEQERRAEIIAAGGDPDEGRDSFETVRAIANDWADSAADPDARATLLDRLADSLDTSEVRALRLAAEAAAAITPRLIQADARAGVRPAVIADDLGVTESYVYRVLREERRKETRTIIAAGVAADPDPEASYEKWKQVLATTTDPAEREQAEAFLAEFRAVIDGTQPPGTTPDA